MEKRRSIVTGIVLVLAVFIMACGGQEPAPTTEPSATGATAPGPTTRTDPTPATTSGSTPAAAAPSTASGPTPIPAPTLPPPPASFSVDVESGSAPPTVEFINSSQGPISSVEWDFGDGTTSTDDSPSHQYTIAGTYTVQLTVTSPGGTDTATIPNLVTIEPGAAATIEVSPSPAKVAVQEALRFSAVVRDRYGNVVSGTVQWSVEGEGGSITEDGRFTAGTVAGTGEDLVKASFQSDSDGLEALAPVTVEPGALSTVVVEPSEVSLGVGKSVSFSFIAYDKFGNETKDVISSWNAVTDAGRIDGTTFTAGTKAGSFFEGVTLEVVQETSRVSVSADAAVNPGPLAGIQVDPSDIVVGTGLDQQFSASGVDQYGNKIAGLAFLWDANGGEIKQNGFYNGKQSGRHQITASATSQAEVFTGSASVVIPPNYSDFSSTNGLNLVGEAIQLDGFLRMTPSLDALAAGGVWFATQLPVTDGFETSFQFQITAPHNGDGLAFVIQNHRERAPGQCCSGYAGIPNSVAVEFDTWRHASFLDPDNNHVSVHTRGTQANSDDHSASLGSARPSRNMSDGTVHDVMIVYDSNVITIFVDDLQNPLLEVPLDLSSTLNLNDGEAWVGLTAQKGGAVARMYFDYLSWSFSPASTR